MLYIVSSPHLETPSPRLWLLSFLGKLKTRVSGMKYSPCHWKGSQGYNLYLLSFSSTTHSRSPSFSASSTAGLGDIHGRMTQTLIPKSLDSFHNALLRLRLVHLSIYHQIETEKCEKGLSVDQLGATCILLCLCHIRETLHLPTGTPRSIMIADLGIILHS